MNISGIYSDVHIFQE